MKIIYSITKPRFYVKIFLKELKKAFPDIAIIQSEKYKRANLYKKIKNLCQNYDIFIADNDYSYETKFIKSLKQIYTVFSCCDDPDGSYINSKPLVSSFDHAFTGAVNWDKKMRMVDKYKEWGAKRADWWPLGIYSGMYNPQLNKENILKKERKIDLVCIGNPQNKTARLLKIYKAFPNMALHGRTFGLKGLLRTYYHILTRKKGWYEGINPLSLTLIKMFLKARPLIHRDVIKTRQTAKVGINVHLSFGPANARLFDIPANGALQICDCKEGLDKVFKIGKEVIVYETMNEAIEKIKYYLKHDEERKKIALAGWKRCMKDYKRLYIFKVAIEKIKKGMLEKGIKKFKNGTLIKVDKKMLGEYDLR